MLDDTVTSSSNVGVVCIPRIVMNCALLSDKLNICHINIQSICARQMSKFNELKLCISDSKLDIVCLTESWLSDSVDDELIAIDGYKLIRNDRQYSRGGGICVYYRNGITCALLSKSELYVGMGHINITEFLFLEIRFKHEKFLLGVVYNPPRNDCSEIMFRKLSDFALHYSKTIIVGDFNTNMLRPNERTIRLGGVIENLGFQCVNEEPTHFQSNSSTLIDLMITNDPDFVLNFNQVSAPAFSKHDIIFSSLNIAGCSKDTSMRTFRDYYNINMTALSDATLNINWNLLYSITDPDLALNFFNNCLTELFNSCSSSVKNC